MNGPGAIPIRTMPLRNTAVDPDPGMPIGGVGGSAPPSLAFRRDHARDLALADLRGILAGLHRMAKSDPVHDRPPEAGDRADNAADARAAHRQAMVLPPVPDGVEPARAQPVPAGDRLVAAQQVDDFRKREQPEADHLKRHAVMQIIDVEDHAEPARCSRAVDGPEHQPDAAHRRPFGQNAACQHVDHGQAEQR